MSTIHEENLESELKARGLDAPRLSPEKIDAMIRYSTYHTFFGKHMVCCLTLSNGFTVIGEAAVVSPENFREDIGRRLAFEDARRKVWGHAAFLLQDKVFQDRCSEAEG